MGRQCFESCWRHRCAHIVGVADAQINNASAGRMRQYGARPLCAFSARQHDRSRARNSPLSCRCPLIAEFQRRAVLSFRRTEMTACRADHRICKSAVGNHPADGQRFRHRRTRAIQSVKRDTQIARRKARGDDLVKQVAAEQHLNIAKRFVRFLRASANRLFKHRPLSAFKGLLSIQFVGDDAVEFFSVRPFLFLLPCNARPCCNAWPGRQNDRLRAQTLAHPITPMSAAISPTRIELPMP